MSNKQQFSIPAIDDANQRGLELALRKFGLNLEADGKGRSVVYRIWNYDKSHYILCAFDVDVRRVLDKLAAKERFEDINLFAPARTTSGATTTLSSPKGTCVVCGEPGGLPCPKMIKEATKARIPLLPQLNIHPGRCRADLRKKLDYAKQHRTTAT